MILVAAQSAPSPIHGTGLFAAQFIPAGTAVWRFDPSVDMALHPKQFNTLSPRFVSQNMDHWYLDPHSGLYVLCGDEARYMNHSNDPAVVSDYDRDRFGLDVATRDIAAGEEITCNYYHFDHESTMILGAPATELPLTATHPIPAWAHPGIKLQRGLNGIGVFTKRKLAAGTVVALLGGKLLDQQAWCALTTDDKHHSLQVEEQMYLVLDPERGIDDYFNHSCDPNLGMAGYRALVTLRIIEAGEELCFDYAMSDGSEEYTFACRCGAKNCRGRITGNDWALPELQHRYRGYFSPYLARRIKRLIAPRPSNATRSSEQ